MKAPYKIFIFFLILISCNKRQNKNYKEIVQKQKKEVAKNPIDIFLSKMSSAIKSKNNQLIKKGVLFPFEFKSGSGGESEFYKSYDELKNDKNAFNRFINFSDAKFLEKMNDSMYVIDYSIEGVNDYYILFTVLESDNTYKILLMEEPH